MQGPTLRDIRAGLPVRAEIDVVAGTELWTRRVVAVGRLLFGPSNGYRFGPSVRRRTQRHGSTPGVAVVADAKGPLSLALWAASARRIVRGQHRRLHLPGVALASTGAMETFR